MIGLRKNLRLFFLLTLLLNSPPLLIFIPDQRVKMIAFFPVLYWVNIPAIPWVFLGIPLYECGEQGGAIPNGPLGWIFIFIFWTFVAYLLTLIVSKISRYLCKENH